MAHKHREPVLARDSLVELLLDRLENEGNASTAIRAAVAQLRDEFGRADDERTFLTVIIRTQGARDEMLRDALLSLLGQDSTDFELLIMIHNGVAGAVEAVQEIVRTQPESFASRIRIVEVTGGYRGRPLNEALRVAQGQYIAVLDDDDLVFAHWVSSFKEAAAASPRALLRAQVSTQHIVREQWGTAEGFRAVSWPRPDYPHAYAQVDHLLVNYSPFMGWAFPRVAFEGLGILFDEELPVCEDWDYILRTATLLGVVDVPHVTAIYHRWVEGGSSYTVHSGEEWKDSEQRVADKMNAMPLLLAPGGADELRDMVVTARAFEPFVALARGRRIGPLVARGMSLLMRILHIAVVIARRTRRLLRR